MKNIEEKTQIQDLTKILKLLPTQVLKRLATAVTAYCNKENESLKPSTIAILENAFYTDYKEKKPKVEAKIKAKNNKLDELIKDIKPLLEHKTDNFISETKMDNLISETKMGITNNEIDCAKKNNNNEEKKILKLSLIITD